MELPITVTNRTGEYIDWTIGYQITFALQYILNKYEDADFIIVTEEDVLVSPDFFVFLNRSVPLLRTDPSLYCATAYNDLTYPHNSYDAQVAYRTKSFPNYGWMVGRSFAYKMIAKIKEILPQNPQQSWDIITYFRTSKGMECIVPEVSRSKHMAVGGTHLNQLAIRMWYINKNYNQDPNFTITNMDMLSKSTYEVHIQSLLSKAQYIDILDTYPCDDNFYQRITVVPDEVLIILFESTTAPDSFRSNEHWEALANCLGIYSLEAHDGHHGLYRLRYGPAHLLLMAYP
ncbi:unnamed protein product, partial [Meganyctiphanes norvegica]